MKKSTIVLIVVLAVIALVAMSLIGTYNGLVSKKEAVTKEYSNLDVMLQRRADLIPNLVNTVKGFAAHENEVIDKVTTAREHLVNAKNIDEKQAANNELTSSLNALMVVVENYPDLKSSENFIALQDELSGTENRISTARRDYNNAVNAYNGSIKRFPNNMLAGMFGFGEEKYFEADEKAQEVPSVNF
jgi:LemA protein